MPGVATVVIVQSDELAAWLGIAGVVVGAALTAGLQWWRDQGTEEKKRRRELRAAADELWGSANTLVAIAATLPAVQEGNESGLRWIQAMAAPAERVQIASQEVSRLSPVIAGAAKRVSTAAFAYISANDKAPAMKELSECLDAFYAAGQLDG